jgi:ABC-type xylose transport system substrate-binding protein
MNAPLDNNKKVLSNGIEKGFNGTIPNGGQYPPISTEGTIELWKYAQNTDIKANTSLITKSMNPIINPFLTSFV